MSLNVMLTVMAPAAPDSHSISSEYGAAEMIDPPAMLQSYVDPDPEDGTRALCPPELAHTSEALRVIVHGGLSYTGISELFVQVYP